MSIARENADGARLDAPLLSPVLVTPNLGTPSAGVMTNVTGMPLAGLSATGTAGATTFLRGDNSWQTAGSTSASDLDSGTLAVARMAAGTILQVVGAKSTTEDISTAGSVGALICGVALTTIGLNSKFFISGAGYAAATTETRYTYGVSKVISGTRTRILMPSFADRANDGWYGSYTAGFSTNQGATSYLDSPSLAASSAITYEIRVHGYRTSTSMKANPNMTDEDAEGSIIVMEVAA